MYKFQCWKFILKIYNEIISEFDEINYLVKDIHNNRKMKGRKILQKK